MNTGISDTKLPSLFDYSIKPEELSIDECRNSDEYASRVACAKLVRRADKSALATIFQSLGAGDLGAGDLFITSLIALGGGSEH